MTREESHGSHQDKIRTPSTQPDQPPKLQQYHQTSQHINHITSCATIMPNPTRAVQATENSQPQSRNAEPSACFLPCLPFSLLHSLLSQILPPLTQVISLAKTQSTLHQRQAHAVRKRLVKPRMLGTAWNVKHSHEKSNWKQ